MWNNIIEHIRLLLFVLKNTKKKYSFKLEFSFISFDFLDHYYIEESIVFYKRKWKFSNKVEIL